MDKEAIEIGRYINGKMNEVERVDFKVAMVEDPFLAEAVAGFQKDPDALCDLPVTSSVKIQWLWSLAGVLAVVFVFLLIPQKVIDVPVITQEKYEGFEELELVVYEDAESVGESLTDEHFSRDTELVPEFSMNEESVELKVDRVYPKPAKVHVESEVPKLKVMEKIIYVLDLKVVDNSPEEEVKPFYELSNLTDFTPANFSTTIAYKRSKQYEGIFPEPKAETYMDKLESGLRYYKAEDYVKALSVFSKLLIENNQDPNAQFYSALSHYHLGYYRIASAGFGRMEKLATLSFAPESEWYKALSLRKQGRDKEAHELLLEIAEGGGHYAERAKTLLEKK